MTFVSNFVWLKRNPSLGNCFHETTENIANSAWCNKSKLLSIPTSSKTHVKDIEARLYVVFGTFMEHGLYFVTVWFTYSVYFRYMRFENGLSLYIFGKRMFCLAGVNYFWPILSVICLFIFPDIYTFFVQY